jgi:hypothetical protein
MYIFNDKPVALPAGGALQAATNVERKELLEGENTL